MSSAHPAKDCGFVLYFTSLIDRCLPFKFLFLFFVFFNKGESSSVLVLEKNDVDFPGGSVGSGSASVMAVTQYRAGVGVSARAWKLTNDAGGTKKKKKKKKKRVMCKFVSGP